MVEFSTYILNHSEEWALRHSLDLYSRLMQGQFAYLAEWIYSRPTLRNQKLRNVRGLFRSAQEVIHGDRDSSWILTDKAFSWHATIARMIERLIVNDLETLSQIEDILNLSEESSSGEFDDVFIHNVAMDKISVKIINDALETTIAFYQGQFASIGLSFWHLFYGRIDNLDTVKQMLEEAQIIAFGSYSVCWSILDDYKGKDIYRLSLILNGQYEEAEKIRNYISFEDKLIGVKK